MSFSAQDNVIDRREALRRVSALLGGVALVGGSSLLASCSKADDTKRTETTTAGTGAFTASDIAYLDEIADTILPETKTPGAKAAKVGAFMALMVTDSYEPKDQKIFRDGMKKLDEASQSMNKTSFMQATPEQRLALLTALDKEQKEYMDKRSQAPKADPSAPKSEMSAPKATTAEQKKGDAFLPDQRKENASNPQSGGAPAITADPPSHYFRMMKELTLLGYFTSEIGYLKAMRYVESPGRYDPCAPYTKGEPSWAPHA
ncbi:MAG: gluconate 2-dehydrogenase subunit 3 family protein [Gemmatimonadaceae bacterium]